MDKNSTTRRQLEQLMRDRFGLSAVVPEFRGSFESQILARIGTEDAAVARSSDIERQRDFSIRFSWGHDHDFGAFSLRGPLGDRHLALVADFIDQLDLPMDLTGKRVLDVGVWTGGTSLLLAGLGGDVVALEEVSMYADTVNYLANSFGLDNLICEPLSLYDFDAQDAFDFVFCCGVLYHVTDPILALRILFNALRDGGRIFLETYSARANPSNLSIALVEGPEDTKGGSKETRTRTGWNYLIPSRSALVRWLSMAGFEDLVLGELDARSRLTCSARRVRHKDMTRAGLSRPSIR